MSDVTLTVEVITQNLEAIKEVEKEVLSLADAVPKLADGFTEGNESLGDFMEKFDKAVGIIKGGNKELELTSKQIDAALDFSKGTASLRELAEVAAKPQKALKELGLETKKTNKEMQALADRGVKSFLGGLTGLTKGLIAVTIAFKIGQAIKDFITDSLDAAKAAGVAAKEFSELEKQTKRLKTQFGTALVGEGKNISFLAKQAGILADNFEVTNATAQKLAAVGLKRVQIGTELADGSLAQFSGTIVDLEGNLVRSSEAMDLLGRAEDRIIISTEGVTDSFQALARAQALFTDIDAAKMADLRTFEALEEVVRADEQAAIDARTAFGAFFDDIKEGFGGETQAILIGLQFEDLGGDEIIDMMNRIKAAFEANKIDREEFRELMGFVFAEEEALKVAQDIQTALEAAIKIEKLLGLEPGEGAKLVEAWLAGVDLVGDKFVDALGIDKLNEEMAGLITRFERAEGEIFADIDKTTIEEAKTVTEKLLETLEEIDGSTYSAVVDIEMRIRESDASTSAGDNGTGKPGGLARGGIFKVGGLGGVDSTQVSFMGTPGETIIAIPPGNTTTNNSTTFGDVFPQNLDLGAMADADEDEFFLG